MYIKHFFELSKETCDYLKSLPVKFGYGLVSEVCFYRTYSRKRKDGGQESWADVVIRVINGTFSIRKNHYLNNTIEWKESEIQTYARDMAISMFNLEWCPPGRGLWAMGTDFVAERGSMALYNCSFTKLTSHEFAEDMRWFMECLMCGVGVGFEPTPHEIPLYDKPKVAMYQIPDSREGWAESVKLAIANYTRYGEKPEFINSPEEPDVWHTTFDYSLIRPKGMPIKGFGGVASGPEPLMRLHEAIAEQFEAYKSGERTAVELKTNIANLVGVCVIAGNVRRSAELGMASINDEVFLDLKDYDKYPHRESYGYMSNNTTKFFENKDFEKLGLVAERVPVRGEPGVANIRNFKYGRIGKRNKYPVRKDAATGLNPCGEITLEHREVCNIVETFPTKCATPRDWYRACEYATVYCSSVSLLPTHEESTNAVMLRNRRIGVGLADYANWIVSESLHKVISYMNKGYKVVTQTNRKWNSEAGVPEAIKKTTVKPGGTVPKLPGCVSGIGSPTFNETLRRISVAKDHPVCKLLIEANVPHKEMRYDKNTLLFEIPFLQKGVPADKVSLWEQTLNLITVQRHWSDNAVSNTLYFKPKWRLLRSISGGRDNEAKVTAELEKYISDEEIEEFETTGEFESTSIKVELKHPSWGGQTVKIYAFDPDHEEGIVEKVLSHAAPHIKSLSLLPHTAKGAYEDMPEEGLTYSEFVERTSNILEVKWSDLKGSDGMDEKFCQGDQCELSVKT